VRILVSVDIEGIAGVVHPEQTRPGNPEYERARRQMTAEANAAALGAFDGGATAVIVNDSHGDFRNLIHDTLDPRVELLLGKPRDLGMMAGVDQDCAGVFLIGWHAKARGTGVLAHTINSFAFSRVSVNGADVGEAQLYGALAAEFSVPIALLTGDDRFIEETAPTFPGAVTVVVKRAHANRVATSLSAHAACEAIRKGAQEAATKCGSLKLQPVETPASISVEAATVAIADLFAMLPIVKRVDSVTVQFSSPTMRHAIRMLNTLSAMSSVLR